MRMENAVARVWDSVGLPDPARDRGLPRVDRRVQWGKHHRDGRLDFGVAVPLRLFGAEGSVRSARFGTRASRITRRSRSGSIVSVPCGVAPGSRKASPKASPNATRMRASTRSVLVSPGPLSGRLGTVGSSREHRHAPFSCAAGIENHHRKAPVVSGQKQRPRHRRSESCDAAGRWLPDTDPGTTRSTPLVSDVWPMTGGSCGCFRIPDPARSHGRSDGRSDWAC